jgi:hypothetical protein
MEDQSPNLYQPPYHSPGTTVSSNVLHPLKLTYVSTFSATKDLSWGRGFMVLSQGAAFDGIFHVGSTMLLQLEAVLR